MYRLAWKNLWYDKVRTLITLVGVTFAVVLMFAQLGAYLGFVQSASILIDHTPGDVWITSEHAVNFDSARPFPLRKLYKVRSLPEVAWAEEIVMSWGLMKLPSGATESVQVIGFNLETGVGGPWQMAEGSIQDLRGRAGIILDVSSLRRLGPLRVGDEVEIFWQKTRIVGFSQGVKSFTTYPIAFTSLRMARHYSRIVTPDTTTFVVVKLKPGQDPEAFVRRLRAWPELRGVDVYTKAEWSWKTRRYWSIQTGLGLGIGVTVFLGFLVGTAIVGQTIYASTMEHLREYGTLKAMGATNRELAQVILLQGWVSGLLGYIAGLGITLLTIPLYERLQLWLLIPTELYVVMIGITMTMCTLSSLLAIRKALRVDPVVVFRF
jgi:putative ABC transport system permease protein